VDTKGKILFIEDVGEYIYNIDRMLYQLKRSGKFKNLAALIVGSFTEMKDTVIPFGKDVYEVIYDAVKEYGFPICFQFPVGHTRENFALKVGVEFELQVGNKKVMLIEK
jgi:muramoyltetrapeptide carboxypeptidase